MGPKRGTWPKFGWSGKGFLDEEMTLPWVTGELVWVDFLKLG